MPKGNKHSRGRSGIQSIDRAAAILTIRHVLDSRANGHVKLVDAPIVEGAVVAAVTASAGCTLDDVVHAAEEARDAHKL